MGAAAERNHDLQLEVVRRRYQEARQAGLTIAEAQLWADSDRDIGELRKLVKNGCPVETIRLIVL